MRFVLFQAASFLSAFLLFGVQPYVAKTLLPGYGGSAIVWATCVVSFQGLLFAGYLLSHAILSRYSVRRYGWCHLLLLAGALIAFRPLTVLSQAVTGNPVVPIVFYLGAHVAYPFLLLSFSTPLLQRWLAQSDLPERQNPYRLFSPSNLGSLSALLAYPFIIQPLLDLEQQGRAFWWGLLILAMLFGILQTICRTGGYEWPADGAILTPKADADSQSIPWSQACWAIGLLSAGSSALLLAVTNAIAFTISSAPLLWILPLCLYLLTFILTFKKDAWRFPAHDRLMPWWTALGLILFLMLRLHLAGGAILMAIAHYGILFTGCLAAHTLVARLKPGVVRHLTFYYAVMSAGGFAGSLVISWIVPLLSNAFVETPLAMASILGGIVLARPIRTVAWRGLPIAFVLSTGVVLLLSWAARSFAAATPGFLLLSAALLILCLSRRQALWLAGVACALVPATSHVRDIMLEARHSRHWRNYYGIYETFDDANQRFLLHGPTQHGRQYLSGPKVAVPLSYYHPAAPAGKLLALPLADEQKRRFGMIGLGTGALTAYALPGDSFQIFELDRLNIRIAQSEFTYLSRARDRGVKVEIDEGDGRLLLQRLPDDVFDYLIIDAFTGGAIPTHLLTVEAFRLYERVTKDDGVILVHISSQVLDLGPLITSVVRTLGHEPLFQELQDPPTDDAAISEWALVSPDPARAEAIRERLGWHPENVRADELPRPWTDRFSNLLSVLATSKTP